MRNPRALNRIFEILRFERKEISSIYFYAILAGLVQLTLPLGIQAIISFVIGGAISTSLVLLIVFVVFGVFVNGLLKVNQMKIIEKIQQQLFVRYSFLYADHLPKLDLKSVKDRYMPELVNRFFDVISLQKGIAKLLLEVPTATIQILFGMLLLSFYHPAFVFLGILLVLIVYFILFYTGNKGLQTSLSESSNKYKVAAQLAEIARMSISYKFIDSAFVLRKTDNHILEYIKSRTAHFKILLIQYWSLIAFKLVITAAMLIVGAVLLVNQKLNIGQFIAAEIVIILVINSVEKLIANLDKVYDVITSLEKINEVLDKPLESDGQLKVNNDSKGFNIQVKGVSFDYGNNDVVCDVNIDIQSGDKVCISGKSGSGKTTLLYLLSGSYRASKGEITLDNIPINNLDVQDLRKHIGVLFSETDIVTGTIMENITFGNDIDYNTVDELAKVTGLRDYIATNEEGYNKLIQPSFFHLPDSVVQKILLTRILASGAKLMLFETPFNQIELVDQKRILEYIKNNMPNTTVVITNTDKCNPDYFDKVVELDCGVIKGNA